MYQSEALWINFSGLYPCAVKIAAGKINAVSGEAWSNGLSDNPQHYAVIPEQPWLDGFNVSEGFIRQFVAMPLGEGFTAEEQITGAAEHGGLQIIVYPMKHNVYVEHFERVMGADLGELDMVCMESRVYESVPDMGLAPGGLMRQQIYEDEYGIDAWDQEMVSAASSTWSTVRNTWQSQSTSHRTNRRQPGTTPVPGCPGLTTTVTARRSPVPTH